MWASEDGTGQGAGYQDGGAQGLNFEVMGSIRDFLVGLQAMSKSQRGVVRLFRMRDDVVGGRAGWGFRAAAARKRKSQCAHLDDGVLGPLYLLGGSKEAVVRGPREVSRANLSWIGVGAGTEG